MIEDLPKFNLGQKSYAEEVLRLRQLFSHRYEAFQCLYFSVH